MTSLYRQETQVRVVKSWLKHRQQAGSLFQSLSGAYELFLSGAIITLGPQNRPGAGRVGGKATEPPPCQPVSLATHQLPEVRILPLHR